MATITLQHDQWKGNSSADGWWRHTVWPFGVPQRWKTRSHRPDRKKFDRLCSITVIWDRHIKTNSVVKCEFWPVPITNRGALRVTTDWAVYIDSLKRSSTDDEPHTSSSSQEGTKTLCTSQFVPLSKAQQHPALWGGHPILTSQCSERFALWLWWSVNKQPALLLSNS